MKKLLLVSLLVSACEPIYGDFEGDLINAGPADPVAYPPAYLGANGNPARPGSGSFTEIAAFAGGRNIGYYSFPFSTSQLATSTPKPDPLALYINGEANPAVPVPVVEVFDGVLGVRPFPTSPVCVPELDYYYDQRRDDIRYDEQSPIFTVLPTASYSTTRTPTWSYQPVVAEKRYTNTGGCQRFRGAEKPMPTYGDGYFLAWPVIDTGAPVYRVGQNSSNSNGITVQKYGWFNNYLVAFLDGGYVPTTEVMAMDGTVSQRMVAQRLFIPRSQIATTMNGMTTNTAPAIGRGYDVIEFERGQPGYSPICQVFTYDLSGPVAQDMLPREAEIILSDYSATLQPANPPYIYCLQVE